MASSGALKRAQLAPGSAASKAAAERFVLPARKVFNCQYKDIYLQRLQALRPRLMQSVARVLMAEGGAAVPIHGRIVDAAPGVECIVVGTVYKDMPAKPCILDEYDDNPPTAAAAALAAADNFCGAEDAAVLEDDHGRIQLALAADTPVYSRPLASTTTPVDADAAAAQEAVFPSTTCVDALVSGLLLAVQGVETETGEFVVSRVFYPDLALPHPAAPADAAPATHAVLAAAPLLSARPAAAAAAAAAVASAAAAASPLAMSDSDPASPAASLSSPSALAAPPAASSAPSTAMGALITSPRALLTAPAAAGDCYVAFLSDLGLGAADSPAASVLLDLAADYLLGLAGGAGDAAAAARVAHVVVAGDTFAPKPPPPPASDLFRTPTAAAEAAEAERARVAEAVAQADAFLTRVAASVPVTLVAGSNDPTNATLPQQPMHPCLFASAATFSTFRATTNPAVVTVGVSAGDGATDSSDGGDWVMLGTAGQNVTDIARFSHLSPLAALALALRARVIAPTAPDTLGCYPYTTADPFVLADDAAAAPAVFFAGNQPVAAAAIVARAAADSAAQGGLRADGERTLLLAVPRFARSGEMLLVNTRTLAVTVVRFGGLDLDAALALA